VWRALQVMVRMLNETGIAAQPPPVVYASDANGRDPAAIFNEAGAAGLAMFKRKPDLILVVLADTNSDVRTLAPMCCPHSLTGLMRCQCDWCLCGIG
jgi:hypothetical protein